jgi:hypothetical protein
MTKPPNLAKNRIAGYSVPNALFTENCWLSGLELDLGIGVSYPN